MFEITLYGNTPSKKSGQVILRRGGKGRPFVRPNNRYQLWKQANALTLKHKIASLKGNLEFPCFLLFFFYRQRKNRFDYVNVIQSVQDFLVEEKLFPDDSTEFMLPFPMGYKKEKKNPRCVVWIFNASEVFEAIAYITKHYGG